MNYPHFYILDLDGEPVAVDDPIIWSQWFEQASRDQSRIVKQDFVEGEQQPGGSLQNVVGVSTVFLGLNHNFGASGPPVLWESLVSGTSLDGEQHRYTSRADALRGHAALLERVRAAYAEEQAQHPQK